MPASCQLPMADKPNCCAAPSWFLFFPLVVITVLVFLWRGATAAAIFFLHPSPNAPCAHLPPLTALMYSCPPPDAAPLCESLADTLSAGLNASCGGVSNAALAAFVESVQVHGRDAPAVESFAVLSWPGVEQGEAAPECWELGARHLLTLQALSATGSAVRAGGEYLEAQLRGPSVAYRPRVQDLGDGRYTVEVHLPADALLAGQQVKMRVWRLWRRWGGLALEDGFLDEAQELLALDVDFVLGLLESDSSGGGGCPAGSSTARRLPGEVLLPPPTQECRGLDFTATLAWHGHWLRVDNGVGARCVPGACTGHPNRLLTPWVYRLSSGAAGLQQSGGCVFHIFSAAEARSCVNTSWWHMHSDSQGRDFADTLLKDVLDVDTTGWHTNENNFERFGFRVFDVAGWRAPVAYPAGVWPLAERNDWPESSHGDPAFLFKISNSFIGHPDPFEDYFGLRTLAYPGWLESELAQLERKVRERGAPAVFLANAGTHDAFRCDVSKVSRGQCTVAASGRKALWNYLEDLEFAVNAWHAIAEVLRNESSNGGGCTRWLWRGASAPGGLWRKFKANPQRLEVMDRLTHSRLASDSVPLSAQSCGAPPRRWSFTGFFDLSWDTHFEGADKHGGPHYGSSNTESNCAGAKCRHVEIMHVHALLNALCPVSR